MNSYYFLTINFLEKMGNKIMHKKHYLWGIPGGGRHFFFIEVNDHKNNLHQLSNILKISLAAMVEIFIE